MFKTKAKAKAKASIFDTKSKASVHVCWKNIINDISFRNQIVKLKTKRLSKHKLSTKLSLSLHHTAWKYYKLSTSITDRLLKADASRPRPRPELLEAKAKATILGPRAVLELEDSPQGPHPCNYLRQRMR